MIDYQLGVIYVVTNKTTGKVYVGQAKNYVKAKDKFIKHGSHRRWIQHVWEAFYRPERGCDYLNNAIMKYGENDFIIQDVHECNIEELNFWEEYFIKEYNSTNSEFGYNLTFGGDNYIRTEHHLEKLSKSMKESFIKRSSTRDNEIVAKYSSLEINNIAIKTTNTAKKRQAQILIQHSGGKIDTGIRAQYDISDAVKRAYAICIQLVTPDKITLAKTAKNILFGDIHDMRETP